MSTTPLLRVRGLSKSFPVRGSGGRQLRAVHNIDFDIAAGSALGLVGESGCGKSTTGRLVLRLIEPDHGSIELDGEDIRGLHGRQLQKLRRRMQIVFQDPLGSLNPRHTVEQIVGEPLLIHGVPARERHQRVEELFREVELPPEVMRRYPHEFSGGQRQRIAIARALALKPALIVADEPVSALDASIQSQILMLMKRLQQEHGVTFLFISHDLGVVRFLCREVAVMYLGEIVERGPVREVFEHPNHPYTKALLASIPHPVPQKAPVAPLGGTVPSPIDPPAGCPFVTRCPYAMPRCATTPPPVYAVGPAHESRCWLNEETAHASN